MATALLLMIALASLASLTLWATSRPSITREEMIERIDALLPQTQCGRCTYSGCRPYASAIASGEADINQCPPGGDQTVIALGDLLGRIPRAVDPRFGVVADTKTVAWIAEAACIGCTKCIQACPVDAIVGASKFMHTVIADQCTGCELCIPPCPVDCIEMRPHGTQQLRRSA